MKIKPIQIQVQKFIALCEATDYDLTLKEVSPELFDIASSQCRNKLYIKIFSPHHAAVIQESDIRILREAREEYNFSFCALGADDAFNCVLTFLEDRIDLDSLGQSIFWSYHYKC